MARRQNPTGPEVPRNEPAPRNEENAEGQAAAANADGDDNNQQNATQVVAQPKVATIRPAWGRGVLYWDNKRDMGIRDDGEAAFYDKYDVDATYLNPFINALAHRANIMGWSRGIMLIPKDVNNPEGGADDLIKKYGVISMERVKAWANSIYSNPRVTRDSQDDQMLYLAIRKSLSPEGITKIYQKEEVHILKQNPHDVKYSGIVAFKLILEEASLGTQAKILTLKTKLTNLEQTMVVHTWNVKTFNLEVENIMLELTRLGEDPGDLVLQLFKAYELIPNSNFKNFIRNLKDQLTQFGRKFNHVELMAMAKHYYETLTQEEKWNVPSEDDKKILALESKLKELKKAVGKKGENVKTSPKTARKGAKDTSKKSKIKADRSWVSQNPQNLKQKEVDGVLYYWCSESNGAPTGCGCDKFVRHKPSACEGKAWKAKLDAKKKAKADALKVSQALMEVEDQVEELQLSEGETDSDSDMN